MRTTTLAKHSLIALGIGLASLLSAGQALAQNMVSISGSSANMRTGPDTGAKVMWELKRGYPLEVVQQKGRWLKVKDFEGDQGWVARSLTGSAPHYVVKSPTGKLRKGPGTQHAIVGKVVYGDVLRTGEQRSGWALVKTQNGQQGWISQKLMWGW